MRSAPCTFIRKEPAVICYADDFIAFAEAEKSLETFKDELSSKLNVKEFGRPSQFFGIQLEWSTSVAVPLKQTSHINRFLRGTGMLGSKPVDSPVDLSMSHEEAMRSGPLPTEEHTRCRSITCSLLYLVLKNYAWPVCPDKHDGLERRDTSKTSYDRSQTVAAILECAA